VDLDTPGVLSTLPDIFDSGYALSKNNTCLGHRPIISKSPPTYAHHYVWETYAEVDERRRHIGSALHTLFENGTVGGGDYPTVGLWSSNRPGKFSTLGVVQSVNLQPEWVIVELALNAYGKVGVSLYDTLGDEAVGAFASRKRSNTPLS
jgi:long-chain acyl-CoA synthetase